MDGGNEQRVAIKFCFKAGLSVTETLVLVQKVYGNAGLNRSNFLGGILDFETEGSWYNLTGQVTVQNRLWGKHCCCCWFSQKLLSNRIKNDSRIFEHPHDCNSSDSERGFGKEKVLCTFCSTLLDTWAKGRSSLILPRHYCDDRCRQKFLINYYGRWDLLFCLWPWNKATEFWMHWWDIPRPKGLKYHRSHIKTMLIIFDVEYIYGFVWWGVCKQSRWRHSVPEPEPSQDGGYVLLWQRYDNNKMVAMRYYGNVTLHLQQYSHRLNLFFFRLSWRCEQRIRTRGKSSKCRIL